MRTADHRLREGQRDLKFTNGSEPAPTGSVSEATLTGLRHERLAAAGGPAGLSPDQAKTMQAAALPPIAPGQARTVDTSGVRHESSRFEHGKGTGNKSPER
ncbi:hypothetical protein [Kribbella soli]|uniref:Uncharacterized protein n=1 Tax=Kribbella soli TaxID=1124743 RepID=A0A4R0HKD3_9ACTN|nr:hypothetical protein [Kribbella soli]TCC10280.1 hypothetical protein E0H45_02840 [Kribbella soli]